MTRSKRIQRIVEISRRVERSAAQTLAASQRQLAHFKQQLGDLQSYREEYRTRLRSGSATPMDGFEAQKLNAFIAQIDRVIEGLEQKIAQVAHAHQRDREVWAEKRSRVDALDQVALRTRKEERHAEFARDQQEIDDRVPVKSLG